MKADIVKDLCPVDFQRHIAVFDLAARTHARILRLIPIRDGGLRIENFNDHLAGSKEALQIVDQHTEIAQRVGQRPGQRGESQDFTGCQLSLDHENAAHQKGRHGQRLRKQINQRIELHAHIGGFQIHLTVIFIFLFKFLILVVLARKRLDHTVSFDILLRHGVQAGKLLAKLHKHRMDNLGEKACDNENKRCDRRQAEHELQIDRPKIDQSRDKHHDGIHRDIRNPCNRMPYQIQVVCHARHQVAGTNPVIITRILILKDVIHFAP